jgi:acetolactate synthase-1/2/3 large subunit
MAITGGELLLDLLERNGVEYIFCSPGTEWTPVWEGLLKRQGQGNTELKYVNCRHEILAVGMATGYAETTGRLPAVLLHAGVGVLHAAMAIRTAYVARVPMIICSGEAFEHRGNDEVRPQGWHWLGLLSDMGGPSALVKNYVKWSNAVKSRDILIDSVLRGCQIAQTAPQGPVFLAIATDVMLRSHAEPEIIRPITVTTQSEPSRQGMEETAKQLIQSKNPIIIAENAGKKPGIVGKLTELAELLSIPVFESSLPFRSNFPKDNPLYAGYNVAEGLEQADTVLVAGSITPWYPPSAHPQKDAKVILLDEAPWHERLPYWGYHVDLSVTTDIEQGLTTLVDITRAYMKKQKQPASIYQERLEYWRNKHDRMAEEWEKEAMAGKGKKPIASRWFFHTAKKVLPAESIIMDETILHTRFVHQYLSEPNRYIKAGYGSLGIGLGEACGVKLAHQDKPVILIVGDGAFNYNPVLAGLGLCQEYHLPIFIIVLDNGGYMAMKLGYQRLYPEGWASSHESYLGVDITPAPDYAKIAEAFGAYGEKLEEPREIESALNRGLKQLAQGRTVLLDVILT